MTAVIAGLLRFAVGWTLLLSGALKARAPKDFVRGVAAYRLLRRGRTVRLAAYTVIAAELAASAGLLGGLLVPWAAALATLLGLTFSTAVSAVLRRGERVDCHCFGRNDPTSALTLVRAALLACASAGLLAIWSVAGPVPLWTAGAAAYAVVGAAVAALAAVPARRYERRRGGAAGTGTGARARARATPGAPASAAGPLAPGTRAPALRLPRVGADTAEVTIGAGGVEVPAGSGGAEVRAGSGGARWTVVGLVLPGGGSWNAVAAGLRRTAEEHSADAVLVCLGPMVKCADWAGRGADDPLVLCDERASTLRAFGVKQLPVAIVLDDEWRVVSYSTPAGTIDRPWSRAFEPAVRK